MTKQLLTRPNSCKSYSSRCRFQIRSPFFRHCFFLSRPWGFQMKMLANKSGIVFVSARTHSFQGGISPGELGKKKKKVASSFSFFCGETKTALCHLGISRTKKWLMNYGKLAGWRGGWDQAVANWENFGALRKLMNCLQVKVLQRERNPFKYKNWKTWEDFFPYSILKASQWNHHCAGITFEKFPPSTSIFASL